MSDGGADGETTAVQAGERPEPEDRSASPETAPGEEALADFGFSVGLRGLRELTRSRAALEDLERALVVTARREGVPWARIAVDLGVAKQTALRRHRAADPVAQALARARATDPWLEELAELRALARRAEHAVRRAETEGS
jgi:hypothetical protein